jgi:opacity protein-like surface antigen
MTDSRSPRVGRARLLAACLLAALALAVPGVAGAADDLEREGFYVAVGGAYQIHTFGEDVSSSLDVVEIGDTAGIGARFGYRFLPWLAAEIEYEWVSSFKGDILQARAFKLESHVLTVNARFIYPDWEDIQPYLKIGVGASLKKLVDNTSLGLTGNYSDFATRVGVGADVYVTENWALYVGVDIVFTTAEIKDAFGNGLRPLQYISAQFGIQYRF